MARSSLQLNRTIAASQTFAAGTPFWVPTCLLLVCLVTALSCRQEVSVNGRDVRENLKTLENQKEREGATAPAPISTPIELPGGLTAPRLYFQTRSVITLDIKSDDIAPGDSIELFNDTTQASLVKERAVVLGLTDEPFDRSHDLLAAPLASYDFMMRLYPLDPDFIGKFAYGENRLRLLVAEANQPKIANSSIYLKDFSFFGVGTAQPITTASGRAGFEGRVGLFSSPIVSNGKGEMTIGTVGMVNR